VPQVWLVDIRDHSIEVCRGRGAGQVFTDTIRWRVPTVDVELSIDLAEVFAGVD
jgi:Uma2 family endonuclease